MNFAIIPWGVSTIHDWSMGTFQAVPVQLALCFVVGSNGGNVLARA